MPSYPPAAAITIENLCQMPGIRGVALTGSWAGGYATEASDVDILVLCEENRFEAFRHQGILIEIIYTTQENALDKLGKVPMESYRWLESKILFDDGGLANMIHAARDAYETYITPKNEKRRLAHWLRSLELKLASAEEADDILRARFLTATNTWPLLEAIWAVNDRPMPPAATAYRLFPQLKHVPFTGWFEALFHENHSCRMDAARSIISWALEWLEKESL